MGKVKSYAGVIRYEYLEDMYNVLLDCAKYNRRFYEEFMSARVLDVINSNGKPVFKIEVDPNPEIYSIIMKQLTKKIKNATIIIMPPK